MIINFALWQTDTFGSFGTASYPLPDGTSVGIRDLSNPILASTKVFGTDVSLPPIPIFELIMITVVVIGAIYYLATQRGKVEDIAADSATGEAFIA